MTLGTPISKKLTIEELRSATRGRLGIVIGPGATTAGGRFWTNLAESIARQFNVESRPSFHETAELAVHEGATSEAVREVVAGYSSAVPASPVLSQLAKIRWTAIISCAMDDQFETRLEQEHLRRPARADVAILSSPEAVPRPGTLPIYKLLGSARRGDLAVTTADILRRTAHLPAICREFLDLVKASPVLCAGMDGAPWLLNPLLGALFGQRGGGPGRLIVLADDPIVLSPTLLQLVPASALTLATASLVDVAKAVEPSHANQQTSLTFSEGQKSETLEMTEFNDIFALVNSHLEPTIKLSERERLLDYLFMPDLPVWDALIHNFDFSRTLAAKITEALTTSNSGDSPSVFVLHGRAASGKTTILKRAALDLARGGEVVCWMKDYWYGDVAPRIEKLLRLLEQTKLVKRVTFFLDAAAGCNEDALIVLLRKAQAMSTPLRVIIASRTSTLPHLEKQLRNNSTVAAATWDLSDTLDEHEWSNLPQYLVHIGIEASQEAAHKRLATAEATKSARDTLALLYWLLPQTRQAISRSIQEEYVTLGDSKSLDSLLSKTIYAAPGSLKDAYAMVAVSTKYGVPLPIEVLTHALQIGYSEWLSASGSNGPAWGLFYSPDDADVEGSSYITRNAVVNDVLLRAINGGVLSRTGEVAVLERLLGACDGTNAVYEQYCQRILVPHKNLGGLPLSEGMSLYSAAERALPHSNRSILHHKALWMKKHGGDIDEAIRVLDQALDALPSPHSDHIEADEHIHTSKAVAILDKMEQGKMAPEEGRQQALIELEKSRSPNFINPHATHVYAGLISKLAFERTGNDGIDRFDLLNRALSDLDRMILLVRSGGVRRRGTQNDLEVLELRRNEIVGKCVDTDEMAETVWKERKSQIGFVVATRARFSSAIGSIDAGRIYKDAFAYWTNARKVVSEAGSELAPELAEVGLMLYYSWQVFPRSRKRIRSNNAPIEWVMMRELAELTLQARRFSRDPFYRFLHGMCLCHLSEWGAADMAFAENRRLGLPPDVLHAPRGYLLHPEGTPWKIQGQLKGGASGDYFDAPDLRHQFVVTKTESWPKGSAVLHAFVAFSFAGPRATRTEDLCRDAHG